MASSRARRRRRLWRNRARRSGRRRRSRASVTRPPRPLGVHSPTRATSTQLALNDPIAAGSIWREQRGDHQSRARCTRGRSLGPTPGSDQRPRESTPAPNPRLIGCRSPRGERRRAPKADRVNGRSRGVETAGAGQGRHGLFFARPHREVLLAFGPPQSIMSVARDRQPSTGDFYRRQAVRSRPVHRSHKELGEDSQ